MPTPSFDRSRFIVGIVLVLISVFLYVFARADFSTGGAIAIGTLGLVSIVTARKR